MRYLNYVPANLQEAPEFQPSTFAEDMERDIGEYPPVPYAPYASPMPFTGPLSTQPSWGSASAQPSWWRVPYIHWSWTNQFRPWRVPPFLPFDVLKRPFWEATQHRQYALQRWQQQSQQQPMYPGGYPGMTQPPPWGMTMMPVAPQPGQPGYPGYPGYPGVPGSVPGVAQPVRRRRRGRRRR